jgi:hypothetical protein
VHRALAAYYVPEGTEPVDPRDALERAIVEDWTAMAEQARRRAIPGDEEQALTDMAAKFNDAVSLERAMIEGYVEWIAEGGQDSNLKITAPETAITAQLVTDVDGDKVPFTAVALLDVRAHRVTDGVRVFVDHKTVGNFTEPRKILHMDPQMLHYHLLEWLNSAAGDERCDAALYNMLRKVKRTAQAKPPFYERIEVHHNEIELRAYHQRLIGATADMIRTERRLAAGLDHHVVAYPTPDRTCSWSCDFFPICPMFDDGSRVEDAINSLYEVGDPMARYDTKIEGLGS